MAAVVVRSTHNLVVLAALSSAAVLVAALVKIRRRLDELEERTRPEQVLRQLKLTEQSRRPQLVILVRHGESEGNADHSLYRTKPDNQIDLTQLGHAQAKATGERIKAIVGDRSVVFSVSPFNRTCQTFEGIVEAGFNVKDYKADPRIREQEFGNLQDEDHIHLRTQQQQVGRFYYRFPTGESGADVYDRAKQFWDSLVGFEATPQFQNTDVVVVVTHGLTMRLILMQLYGWSPTTFHTVWNADNCSIYCLRRVDSATYTTYALDSSIGDFPKSSMKFKVSFKDSEDRELVLNNYLAVPPPRLCRFELIADLLGEQHDDVDPLQITHLVGISPKSREVSHSKWIETLNVYHPQHAYKHPPPKKPIN